MQTYFQQAEYDVRCDWGPTGVAALAPGSAAVVIVDVLSFSTSVDVAVARGAAVYPYAFRDDSAQAFAAERGALLASPRRDGPFSLSPASLVRIPSGTRLVLPSPNGATLSLATGARPTFAGCLRNAAAVGAAAGRLGPGVAVIPAGERWPDGTLRPSLEDWLGAGAIIHHLPGRRSPEAAAAEALYRHFAASLTAVVADCASGRELIERGYADDVALASQFDCSTAVPMLRESAYVNAAGEIKSAGGV